MSGYENPRFDPIERLFHETTLDLVEKLLDGDVTPRDVAFLDSVGPLVTYTELLPKAPMSDIQHVRDDSILEKVDDVFDITMATNVLGDAVHWTAELIEETGEKLRVALIETAIQNADKEGENWARKATALEIITFGYDYALLFKEEKEKGI